MTKHKILVVDDDDILRLGITQYLTLQGYEVSEADSCARAREVFQAVRPDAAIVDYMLPDGNALDLLPRLREIDPNATLLIMTGHGTIDLAVRAIKEGAEQFLTKPLEFPTLEIVLKRALENQRARRKLIANRGQEARPRVDPFVGTSEAIRRLAEDARRIAGADSPVLIEGETGSGKSILAQWLHANSPRADEAFVDFNCAGLARELVETEFFGHEKGAFTGAVASKIGLLEVAHRGTVFLDEIGDMDLQIQPKLLKVLEEKRFRRVGDLRDRQVDVRLVAATHQDLGALVQARQFRADLYFRISTIPLTIPPLRERKDDIIPLAERITERVAFDLGAADVVLSPGAREALVRYQWPGNIRELRNVLERAILLRDGDVLTAAGLRLPGGDAAQAPSGASAREEVLVTLVEAERRHIVRVLDAVGGSVVKAAAVLGVGRSTLYQKMKRLDIVPPE